MTSGPASPPADPPATHTPASPQGDLSDHLRHIAPHVMVYLFAFVPFIALIAAVPLAWGWGLTWVDVGLTALFYVLTMLGVTVGFHRYFTHGAFRAKRALRIAPRVAGSMAVQGPIRHWVADHRRHHLFADKEGDPHSPWAFGTSPVALVRGFWHAHMVCIFDRSLTNQQRFTPDLLADPDMRAVNRWFTPLTVISLLAPPLLGGLITWSWWGWRSPRSSGRASCASASRTTSRGPRTRSATSSASAPGGRGTARRTSGCSSIRSRASRGTTCTTPTPPPRATASAAVRSTSRRV